MKRVSLNVDSEKRSWSCSFTETWRRSFSPPSSPLMNLFIPASIHPQVRVCSFLEVVHVIIKSREENDEWIKDKERRRSERRESLQDREYHLLQRVCVCVTLVMWLWRAEHPGNHRRQVLIGGAKWLTGEMDQIYRDRKKISFNDFTWCQSSPW